MATATAAASVHTPLYFDCLHIIHIPGTLEVGGPTQNRGRNEQSSNKASDLVTAFRTAAQPKYTL